MSSNRRYVLYHADCHDGFASAYSFWKKYKENVTYYAVFHNTPLPSIEDGSEVYIVDFSYNKNILLDLKARVKSLVLIDHHKSAEQELKGLDFALFDMSKSGARLVYEYLNKGNNGNSEIPKLFLYVEDNDLWLFKHPHSKAINAYIKSIPYDFNAWEKLENDLENNFELVHQSGETLLRQVDVYQTSILLNMQMIDFEGHHVPCVNTSILNSEAGNTMLKLVKDAPFSISWFINKDGKIKLSFRSRGDFDVSVLAKKFGGGGHKAAAGCSYAKIPGQEVKCE